MLGWGYFGGSGGGDVGSSRWCGGLDSADVGGGVGGGSVSLGELVLVSAIALVLDGEEAVG